MEKYKEVRYLGYGSFGEVWLVESKKTTKRFAMKRIQRGQKIDKYVAREIINQKSLHHPNVIQFKEVVLSSNYLGIVMEYAEGGDLHDKIFTNSSKKGLDENMARFYFLQLISGVFYCHKKEICHRDLKPENILLDGSDPPCLKICDFGFSKSYRLHSKPKSAVGTPQYSAPEVCSREYDGKSADIWSCGVILYTMLEGEHPNYRPNDTGEPSDVYETNACPFSLPDSLSPDSIDLLSRMLVVDPLKRIAIKEIMKHQWFKKKLKGKLVEAFQVTRKNPRFALQSDEEIEKIIEKAKICLPEDAIGMEDEDLDALVSVVNDDDVINMMEGYDKLGLGDGFTRPRIFLLSHPEQEVSPHYVDGGDDRETERRYVDALNNLNDSSEFRKQQQPDSPRIGPVEDIHVGEQFFNRVGVEGGLHNQRASEIPMLQFNLRHLTIPHMGSAPHQPQRYTEMEAPWSPAYYSPRHLGHHDPRQLAEYPSSPSSARYCLPLSDLTEKGLDRVLEEYSRQQVSPQPMYEHRPQYYENVMWVPSGAISGVKSGFPGNIFRGPNVVEGNSVCEHCRMAFQRNQPHLEHGLLQVSNPRAECPPNRETFMLNTDAKLHHGIYPSEQNHDLRSVYNETQNHEKGWILQNHLNAQVDIVRVHASGAPRLNDHYIGDGAGMNFPMGHGNLADGHPPSNYAYHRAGPEIGNDVLHDQSVAAVSHMHIPPHEKSGIRYGNLPYAYGVDNLYPVSHGNVPGHAIRRTNSQHVAAPYEASSAPQQVSGTANPGFVRPEVSPRFFVGMDNHIPWVESSQKILGFDGSAMPEYSYSHALKLNPNSFSKESLHSSRPPPEMVNFATLLGPVPPSDSSSTLIHDKVVSSVAPGYNPDSRKDTSIAEVERLDGKSIIGEEKEANQVEKVENSELQNISHLGKMKIDNNNCQETSLGSTNSVCLKPAEESGAKLGEKVISVPPEDSKLSAEHLSFLPELIASVKRAALEGAEEVKVKVEECADLKEATGNEIESANAHGDQELDFDNDNVDTSKIEPTKAEAEALVRGLQSIKNDDLEEIRELGSGTYGAVYHANWKGSDVAVKRIKASCFAGRPSEREHLIADFWKEALILSSLHHPNVVSFYGIVRDGPDGSLATVTEFMVNGSLKQFLQKKDRTIDRRKRLIIAKDAAFGMEYLHGKNIVHSDLKCKNLLVNMRDPQRPVCKIGDLGLSKVKQQTLVSGGVRGTLPWMAPELLSGKSHMVTEKIDVYSFGIVMWELLTGDEPYADLHCASIIGGIVNNTLRPQSPTWCDPEWKSLMESCWASAPATRPSFSEISQKLRNMAAAMNVR